MEIELEKIFLIKEFPADFKNSEHIEIIDIYVPQEADHPHLRIRKLGERCEMTKKSPIKEGDSSAQYEQTIKLSPEEFETFSKIDGKKLRKYRYYYPWFSGNVKGKKAEIDVYLDDLSGLCVADFEFDSLEDKSNFMMPDFCLSEVTQEEFIAAGMLAGKKYEDLKPYLEKYHYKKLDI